MRGTTLARSTGLLLFSSLLLLGSVGCGDDDPPVGWSSGLVGGACFEDYDCAEMCATGSDFPYGTCTVSCKNDYNCPAHTLCIDKKGGVCLMACYDSRDCRPYYYCKEEKRKGASGKAYVCID